MIAGEWGEVGSVLTEALESQGRYSESCFPVATVVMLCLIHSEKIFLDVYLTDWIIEKQSSRII